MSPTTKPSMYLQDMSQIKQLFERFDTNDDGRISAEELSNFMQVLGRATSPHEISCMMEEIDSDKDGFISFQEFAEFCRAQTDDGDGELREAFAVYDENGDGLISVDELHLMLTRLGESCTREDCEKIIAAVDADGDGFVSFQEFKQMMTNHNKSQLL